jgi:hypothetical protein
VDSGGNNGRRTGDFLLKAGVCRKMQLIPNQRQRWISKSTRFAQQGEASFSSQLGDERAQSTSSSSIKHISLAIRQIFCRYEITERLLAAALCVCESAFIVAQRPRPHAVHGPDNFTNTFLAGWKHEKEKRSLCVTSAQLTKILSHASCIDIFSTLNIFFE